MVPAKLITLSLVSPVPVYFNVDVLVAAPMLMVPVVPSGLLAPLLPTVATVMTPL